MTESESGAETRISRRKAIKLGAVGAAGGAAAWLLPGTASAGRKFFGQPPGMCARGSGDVCGRQIRQCGTSKGEDSFGALCVCASDSRSPGVHCVEDRPDLGFLKCSTKFDCDPGQVCVKRCIDLGIDSAFGAGQSPKRAQQLEVIVSICAWPCSLGPAIGEGED